MSYEVVRKPDPASYKKRECGDCSLCCKVLSIVEIAKPQGRWCQHAMPGRGGCAIYDARPHECASFSCAWRSGLIPEELKPNKVKAVVGSNLDGTALLLHIYPGSPTADRAEPLASFIEAVVKSGVPVIATCLSRRTLYSPPGRKVDVRDPANGETWISNDAPEQIVPG